MAFFKKINNTIDRIFTDKRTIWVYMLMAFMYLTVLFIFHMDQQVQITLIEKKLDILLELYHNGAEIQP